MTGISALKKETPEGILHGSVETNLSNIHEDAAFFFPFFFFLFKNFSILFFISQYIIIFSTVQHGDPVTHTCIHSFFSH